MNEALFSLFQQLQNNRRHKVLLQTNFLYFHGIQFVLLLQFAILQVMNCLLQLSQKRFVTLPLYNGSYFSLNLLQWDNWELELGGNIAQTESAWWKIKIIFCVCTKSFRKVKECGVDKFGNLSTAKQLHNRKGLYVAQNTYCSKPETCCGKVRFCSSSPENHRHMCKLQRRIRLVLK